MNSPWNRWPVWSVESCLMTRTRMVPWDFPLSSLIEPSRSWPSLNRCLNQGARFKPPPSHIVAERVIPLQSPGVRCWDTQRLLECKRLKSCIKDITTLFATPSINYDPSSAPLAIIYILDIAWSSRCGQRDHQNESFTRRQFSWKDKKCWKNLKDGEHQAHAHCAHCPKPGLLPPERRPRVSAFDLQLGSEDDCRDCVCVSLCSQMQPLQPNIIRQSYTSVRRSLVVAERKRRCRTKAAKMGKLESVKRACTNKKEENKRMIRMNLVVHVSNQMQLLNKNQEEMSHTT